MKPHAPSISDSIMAVRAVYRELEERPVERRCLRRTECCQFKLTGKTPYLTAGEALLAAKAFRATGRTRLENYAEGVCPFFGESTRSCLIYEDRPFACRTHFCAAAGGPYARRDVVDLVNRLEEVDRLCGGDGGRPIAAALKTALERCRRD